MKFNKEKQLTEGIKAEKVVIELLKQNGFSVRFADIYDDCKLHVDIYIKHGTKEFGLDVKGLRRKKRHDKEVNENIHYVELVNVEGRDGWLYGHSHYFAFETIDYFIIVEKIKLQKLIKDKVRFEEVSTPDKALYRCYQRKGRRDVITLVKTIDLLVISSQILYKNENNSDVN